MATINFDANKHSIEGKSQVVLRTNPALSSNVKLVVDSAGDIFLDSISANRTLSDQRYKRFELDPRGHYAYDLASFYAGTPLDTVYEPLRRDSDLSVYREYYKQYEEQYNYGARLNGSKLYDENIRFMAPLLIDKQLPEYFVIYRVEEPVSDNTQIYVWDGGQWTKGVLVTSHTDYNVVGRVGSVKSLPTSANVNDAYIVGNEPLEDTLASINNRIVDMLSNATIVKTFDLRKATKIGQYLDRFVNDDARPEAPLTVSFESDTKTSWNGIDLRKGGFTSKGEYIYRDFTQTDREEILNNQFITEGLKRNSIVSANLINLEFLFEDFDNPYEVNRYIGVYVTAHEEGSFKTVSYRNEIITIDESSVETNFDLTGTGLTAVDMLPHTELEIPSLNWVKFNNRFSHIKNLKLGSSLKPLQLKVNAFDTVADSKYVRKEDTLRIKGISDNNADFIKVEVVDRPDSSDAIVLAMTTEVKAGNTVADFTLYADSALSAGTFDGTRYSNKGTLEQVSFALKSAMDAIIDQQFVITLDRTEIVINNYTHGNRLNTGFLAIQVTNNVDFLNVITGNANPPIDLTFIDPQFDIKHNVYGLTGGSSVGNTLLIDAEELDDTEGDVYIKSGETFAKIIETVQDPYYTNLYRVCVNKPIDKVKVLDSTVNLWIENKVYFGKFAAIDFVDFDFDFFSTMHSELKELSFEDEAVNVMNSQLEDLASFQTPASEYFTTLLGAKESVTPNSTGVFTVSSEYDRLQENYIKDFALTSRVVPTINKWRYLDGVNVKENPYMLSVSESFGKTNFAPDLKVDGRDPNAMTHEWYYIYGHADYFDSTVDLADELDLITKTYSYLQPEKSIDLTASKLMDVNNDWFNSIFVYEGYDITGIGFAPAKITNKYTRFRRGSNSAPAEAMFRGLKVKAYARKEFNETNPKNLINTPAFNDYKFSAVLNYKFEQTENDSVVIKAIQNKKFKAITLYIEVNTSDEIVSFVNRKLLYNLRDFVDITGTPINTKVNGYLDFSVPQDANPKTIFAKGIGTDFVKDIQLNANGGYGSLNFDYNGYTWALPIISVDNANTITFQSIGGYLIEDVLKTSVFAVTTEPSGFWADKTFTYVGGGYNLAKSTFESISAKAIADLLNSNDSEKIEYITVEEDGTVNTNRFILNIEDGHNFKKPSVLLPAADPNKPASYKVSSGKVGYVLDQRSDSYMANLVRMSGDYTPLTRTVVSFTDIYRPYKTTQIEDDGDVTTVPDPREKALYERYHRMGVAFGSYQYEGYSKWGLIENAFYHKVNPEKADGILKLSNSTSSTPVYRLIDEIAIEKRDINVFRSSWEDSFYVKNGTKQANQNVYGTLSAYEESAYLASTLNLPKTQYEITNYADITTAVSLDDMKAIKASKNFTGDIVKFEDSSSVYLDLYLNNMLVDLLEADNAGVSLKKYVLASQSYGDKTTVNDDIRKYIEVNLLKLLNASEIRLFNMESKLITESQVLSADSLNDILSAGFKEDKSFRLEYDNTNPLNIKLIYNKRPGFKHQFYIYTKINS